MNGNRWTPTKNNNQFRNQQQNNLTEAQQKFRIIVTGAAIGAFLYFTIGILLNVHVGKWASVLYFIITFIAMGIGAFFYIKFKYFNKPLEKVIDANYRRY